MTSKIVNNRSTNFSYSLAKAEACPNGSDLATVITCKFIVMSQDMFQIKMDGIKPAPDKKDKATEAKYNEKLQL